MARPKQIAKILVCRLNFANIHAPHLWSYLSTEGGIVSLQKNFREFDETLKFGVLNSRIFKGLALTLAAPSTP
jgi:hypothetical protein